MKSYLAKFSSLIHYGRAVFAMVLLYFSTLFATQDIPQKISVRRLGHSWPTDFVIEEELSMLGRAEVNFFGGHREYGIFDKSRQQFAKAKLSQLRSTTIFTIEDADEETIGYIEEQQASFKLFDENHNLIASSQKNVSNTKVKLVNSDGDVIATLTRPWFRDEESWSLDLHSEEEWEERSLLWIFLPVIHTDYPFWSKFHLFHDQKGKIVPRRSSPKMSEEFL